MKKALLFSIVSVFIFSACRQLGGMRIRGNGNIIKETRSVGSFNSIDVGGAIAVYVKQDSTTSVVVETDENVQEYIEAYIEGSTLEIHMQNNINLRTSNKVRVYISNPSYRSFEISGASEINSENTINSGGELEFRVGGASKGKLDVDAPKISADLNGASHLDINGRTKDLRIEASGASKFYGYDLQSENADVNVTGASRAELFASVSVSGHASGASHLYYKGNARENVETSGASKASKTN